MTAMEGFRLLAGKLSLEAQRALLAEVLACLEASPPYHALMPRTGRPMSVAMTNLGPLGWWSDVDGYRYVPAHPETGRPWPGIPVRLLDLWEEVADWPDPPEACLVNVYRAGARLGLHVDADEDAREAPVVSVSLGDRAVFRLGGLKRSDPTLSFRLSSGDVCVLGGDSRRAYHGVDRIVPGSSTLVPGGGRINLTLRRVTRPKRSIETDPPS
jgi:alkylated DNA repair protein (DNA oxidative demethylase)